MDYAKALTYVMEDDEILTKLGIWAALTVVSFFLFGIPMIFAIGYMVAISHNVKKGLEKPLPAWDDWGKLFSDGLNVIVVRLIYTAPFWLLMCGVFASIMVGFGVAEGGAEDAAAAIMGTTGLIFFCLSMLLAVAYFFINPALMVLYLRTKSIGGCLNFGAVRTIISEQASNILMVMLVIMGTYFVISTVAGFFAVIPCIGIVITFLITPVTTAYIGAVSAHLMGQLARVTDGKEATAEAW